MYERIAATLGIQPIVLLTMADTIRGHEFGIEDIFDSSHIDHYVQTLQEQCQSIPPGQIHPHVSFLGLKDYPNQVKECLQMKALEIGIAAAEAFLRKVVRNPIRIMESGS